MWIEKYFVPTRTIIVYFFNISLTLFLISCGTTYRSPYSYRDRQLPVGGQHSDPDIVISPYTGRLVDVSGIPYGMVISDPTSGGEFVFSEPRRSVYQPTYASNHSEMETDTAINTYVPTPPQKTQKEIEDDARVSLHISLALRMGGNQFQPESIVGVFGKGIAMGVGSSGIESSLKILMPEASDMERVVVKAVLISFADLEITPEQISLQVTKNVFMAELAKKNPAVAQNIEVASTAWDLMRESIKVANKQE